VVSLFTVLFGHAVGDIVFTVENGFVAMVVTTYISCGFAVYCFIRPRSNNLNAFSLALVTLPYIIVTLLYNICKNLPVYNCV